MKTKSFLMLAVAVGCGLIAMLGVQHTLSKSNGENKEESVEVLHAVTDISPGVFLDDTNVAFKTMPISSIPDGAVTLREEYEQRALKSHTVEGEIIMKAKLGEKGAAGAAIAIPQGMLVVTVPVDKTANHSGQLMPGDHVDVFVTYKQQEIGKGTIQRTKCILQCLKVFSADSIRDTTGSEAPEINAKNISLLVKPDDAGLLNMAVQKGTIHLALRAPGDLEIRDIPEYDDSALLSAGKNGKQKNNSSSPSPSERIVQKTQVVSSDVVNSSVQNKRELIQNQLNASANIVSKGETAKEEEEEEAGPVWKLQIYDGEVLREVDVELEPSETDAVSKLLPSRKVPSKVTGELGGIMSMLKTTEVIPPGAELPSEQELDQADKEIRSLEEKLKLLQDATEPE